MSNSQLHIKKAYEQYTKLLDIKSDFICRGIKSYYQDSKKLNDLGFFLWYYFVSIYTQDNFMASQDVKIPISKSITNFTFYHDYGTFDIQCKGCEIILKTKDSKDVCDAILSCPGNIEKKPQTLDLSALYTFSSYISDNKDVKIDYSELEDFLFKYEDARDKDTIKRLFEYIENRQDHTQFNNWYYFGINNLSYKIFNAFVLSFTSAEYLREESFTSILNEFILHHTLLDRDNEYSNISKIPMLIRSVRYMAIRYQLFCRQVESQLSRKPTELYFCLTRSVPEELEYIQPIIYPHQYRPDASEGLYKLFAVILDIGFIDHRFILEQNTIERLIYALETIKGSGFISEHEDWYITSADVENLESAKEYPQYRIRETKILLKLVYAKGCTLWKKINLFLKSRPKSEYKEDINFQDIHIINRESIQNIDQVNNNFPISFCNNLVVSEPILDKLHEPYNSDVARYNHQVKNIHKNRLWFKEKEKVFDNYKKLTPDDVANLYKKYIDRKRHRNIDSIIFFSEKFLTAALKVIYKDIKYQLDYIKDNDEVSSERTLSKINQSIKLFRELIEEMRKLAEFSEKFGLMEDQHPFQNSFYAPMEQHGSILVSHDVSKFERKDIHNLDKLNLDIKRSWVFMASTDYPPAYPNHYKRIYERYDSFRKNISASLYMQLPSFLNKVTLNDIAKERTLYIQIMAIFASVMAFVTTSVSATKLFETAEGYKSFAYIFSFSLIVLVLLICILNVVHKSEKIYELLMFVLCLIAILNTDNLIINLIMGGGCLIVIIHMAYDVISYIIKVFKNWRTHNSND